MAFQYPKFEYLEFISSKNRIEKTDLNKGIKSIYYICGPDSLKDGIVKHLQDLNIPKSKIYIEHFADGYTPWFGLL